MTTPSDDVPSRDWWPCACGAARPMTQTHCHKCGESIDAANVAALREQIEEIEQCFRHEIDESTALQNQVDELTSQLATERAARERAEASNDRLRASLIAEEEARDEIEAELESAEARLAKAESECEKLRESLASSEKAVGIMADVAWHSGQADKTNNNEKFLKGD